MQISSLLSIKLYKRREIAYEHVKREIGVVIQNSREELGGAV